MEPQADAHRVNLPDGRTVTIHYGDPDDCPDCDREAEALADREAPGPPLYSGPHGNYEAHAVGSCPECDALNKALPQPDTLPDGASPCPPERG